MIFDLFANLGATGKLRVPVDQPCHVHSWILNPCLL